MQLFRFVQCFDIKGKRSADAQWNTKVLWDHTNVQNEYGDAFSLFSKNIRYINKMFAYVYVCINGILPFTKFLNFFNINVSSISNLRLSTF